MISLDSVTHEIYIASDVRELDGQQWTLKISVSSSSGSQSLSTEFDVVFRDACWEATLTAATFSQSSYVFELYRDILEVDFTPMTVDLDCGGTSYELERVSGPNINLNEFRQDATSISADLFERKWIGTHTLRLRSFNGVLDPTSTLPNNGIFASVISSSVTIVVQDPCKETEIATLDLLESFEVPEGETSNQLSIIGPTNSIS